MQSTQLYFEKDPKVNSFWAVETGKFTVSTSCHTFLILWKQQTPDAWEKRGQHTEWLVVLQVDNEKKITQEQKLFPVK